MPPPPRKKKGPAVVTEGQLLSRAKGCLLGLAVGEALGVTNERRNLPAEHFPGLNEGFHVDLRGGGARELRPGQVSWASEMAFCLSTALRNFNGYDVVETAKTYTRWLADAHEPPEVVKLALEQVLDGRSPEFSGKRTWLENGQRFKDNAALARAAPIGVFLCGERDERLRATLDDTAITHFAPLCQLASATFNALIAAALLTPTDKLEAPEVLKVLEAELSLAAATLGRKESDWVAFTKEAADLLREDILAAQQDDPWLYGPELHLFTWPTSVRVTFRLALWELFHAPGLEAALIDVANRGGDAGTNCAVTGALLGAVYGDQAVPERWTELLMEAPGPMGGVHWSVYHPRFLVTLEPKRG
jgi:ADP-ribosylglycohydrolase